MSAVRRDTSRGAPANDWTRAEGVLPVERALADEHEAMHGTSITAALEAVTVEFDSSQIVDVPAFARDLRDALGPGDSGISAIENPPPNLQADLTPRDAIGKLLLRDPALRAALKEYEVAPEVARPAATDALGAALAQTLNALLGRRLMDEPAFRSFVQAGAIDALGHSAEGETKADTAAHYLRRANRELLEAAFPSEIALIRDRRLAVVFDAARKRDTAALCLSGGGIRSSTFALGIMQGLARHGLLAKFDYLSTVSGGGLSGGWLSAWMRRDGARAVHHALSTQGREKLQPEPEPVQGLRAFSNWLTPRGGGMSVDSWTVIATVLRNLVLNWLVLIPLLAGLVMLPRLLLSVLAIDFGARPADYADKVGFTILGGAMLILLASAYIEWIRVSGDEVAAGRRRAPTQARVLAWFIVPLVLGSMIVVTGLWIDVSWNVDKDTNAGVGALAGLVAVVVVTGTALIRRGSQTRSQALKRAAIVVASGVVGYGLVIALLYFMSDWADEWQRGLYMTVGPALLLMGSVITSQLYTGLTSNQASDAEREWAARANAWVLLVAIVWLVASGLVLLGPNLLAKLWAKLTLMGVGGVTSWMTVHLGKRQTDSGGGKPSSANMIRSAMLSLAMPAVVACLVIGLSAANDASIDRICTGDMLSGLADCTPPSADGTVAPMLDIVAEAQLATVARAHRAFISQLSDHQSSKDGAADSLSEAGIVAASHAAATTALALDSIERRRIRPLGILSKEFDSLTTLEEDAHDSIRAFTAARNALVVGAPLTDAVLAQTRVFLATRAAIGADMRLRANDTAAVHASADSILQTAPHSRPGNKALWKGVLALMGLMIVAGLFFSTVVNTNTFSLHAMWKARTVRAFLGTTRAQAARNPNPFTGFDRDDDVALRELWPSRVSHSEAAHAGERSDATPPMHVLNVTLNLAAGRNLAWQQRKGESMTLTPLHAGSAFSGYRPMTANPKPDAHSRATGPGYGGKDGVSLGTAMAVSGAAASPNDGSGTTALSAFLMTFFNARLGWWLGNPGAPGADTWVLSAPKQRLTPILAEMFGLTSDRGKYVYLSDGGHFENLALYEMVFRRCRFIVVSDAGADPDYTFEDLGNAVRKIRIDFGIPIDFDNPVNIGRSGTADGAYWATAKIRYSAVDMPADSGCKEEDYDGVLVYIKPAVYGKLEPRDVVNYSNLSPTFPQESSADQFFTESQFESYRALGSWIIDQLVANSAAPGAPATANAQRPGSLLSAWPSLASSRST